MKVLYHFNNSLLSDYNEDLSNIVTDVCIYTPFKCSVRQLLLIPLCVKLYLIDVCFLKQITFILFIQTKECMPEKPFSLQRKKINQSAIKNQNQKCKAYQ